MAENAPRRVRQDTVEALLASWCRPGPGGIDLDLRQLNLIERSAGVLVSNALLGTFGECSLRVRLPSPADLDPLLATGLAFALANRPGPTVIESDDQDLDLDPWRRSWTPISNAPWALGQLFSPALAGETELVPDLEGASFAAFVNPHLAAAGMSQTHPLATVVWPWLDELLPGRTHKWPAARKERQRFIEDVGCLLSETVLNIAEHAIRRNAGTVHSLVQVAVTRGGNEGFDRIYLSVQDTGPGITATARGKLPPIASASLTDHQLFFKLFDGSLPSWHRGRGLGLPDVLDIVRRRQGSASVTSLGSRLRAQAEAPRLTTGPGSFVLDGTVILLMLPLNRL